MDQQRYARHLLLPEVGLKGQQTLLGARVLVIGAGGLGCPALQYLAAAGVGTLDLVDFDRVDVTNLQRQVLYRTTDIGRLKVEAAAEALGQLNPDVRVVPHPVRLDASNALALFERADVVLDGTDDLATRYLISDAAELTGKPVVYGAILRFEGQVSVFNLDGGPSYRDLYPHPPAADSVPNCAEAGVLGVLPGVIGSLQATEVLKILLGIGPTLSGRLLVYDARSLRFHELALSRDPQRRPPTTLADTELRKPEAAPTLTRLTPDEANALLASGWRPAVVDLRTEAERALSTSPHTTHHVPHRQLPGDLPRDVDLLLFCKGGARSQIGARTLHDRGYSRLFDIVGGLDAWIDV